MILRNKKFMCLEATDLKRVCNGNGRPDRDGDY